MDIGARRGHFVPPVQKGRLTAIVFHWSGGAYGVNDLERDSYNFLVDYKGNVVPGDFPPEAQIPPLVAGKYAAHALNANSRRIGLCLDAMGGAIERPFNPGKYPITKVQLEAACKFAAQLNSKYQIEVTRQTNLTHAEIQPTLGIRQNNKWDVCWLPGMDKPGDAVQVGDVIRKMVKGYM